MNKLGMHIHGMKPGIIQAVELLQPRTITMMDPTAQELRDVRSVADPIIVVRKYEDGKSFQQLDPGRWAEQYYQMVGDAVDGRMVALGMNEPFGHDSRHLCAPFDEWNRDFILRCRELGPMDGGALAMATGNWTGANGRYKITDDFPGTCEIAEKFLLHEYCWPTLQAGVPWHVLRYRAWIKDLEAVGKKDFFIIISEAGLTQAVIAGRPDHGWRSGGPEGVTEDSYISTIDWYNAELCKDWRVLGCCLYDYAGSHYDWETFEQLGLENRIYQIQAPEIPEPPEPPNGGNMIRVVDENYNEQTEEWAKAKYGIDWERANVAEGESVWRLVELWEHPGPAAHITQTLDENGNPLSNIIVAWRFSSLPEADIAGPNDWYKNFVYGPTNANGDVGPAMSTDSYIGEGECGPHQVWVHNDNIKSDLLKCIGMLAGTFHSKLDAKFKLVRGGETPPEGDGMFKIVGDKKFTVGSQNQVVINCQGTKNFYDTRGDLRVGEDPENPVWEDPNPINPETLTRYEITTEYTPGAGEAERLFWVRLRKPDTTPVGDWWDFLYETGKKGTWEITVEWIVPEPPPPVDGELLEEVREIRLLVAEIRDFLKNWEPPEPPEPPDPEPPKGYFGQYYNNRDLQGTPALTRWDTAIFFDWAGASPAPEINADNFSVRWTATREFEAGTWRFHVRVDDGVRLFVDGQLLIDKWVDQAPHEYVATKVLAKGEHDIRLEYYEKGGGATCEFWYVKL